MSQNQEDDTEFDIFSPPSGENPFAVYDGMRGRCPVARSERLGGYWIATRHQVVEDVAKNPDLFSSSSISVPKDAFGDELAERPPITLDPPRHGPFRKLLLPAFGPRQIRRMEPLVREHARELLAEIEPRGHCDAAAEYAKKIPLRFMARMMGCPPEQQEAFGERMRAILDSNDMDEIQNAMSETQEFLQELIEDRTKNPQDDLVGLILSTEIDGIKLNAEELLGALVLIITAGIDTTWSAIGSSLWHLARTPEDRARLSASPELIPSAVEEFLRSYSPVQIARVVTRDTDFHGARLNKGDSILMGIPSANRDAVEFPDSDRVVIDRATNRHLAFGVGIHRCIGSTVARLEMRVALEEWLRAIPDFSLAGDDPVTWSTGHVWGPRRLDVEFGGRHGSPA
ncbi:cytochrome P450 [Streptomyces tsukubensis]|uniref:cytochrome P450 n=1 Tax=Streptomyces tsukubensis TaxID=83656 RepID=UPI00098F2D74|nr:cytochrome P450 [Streptomyces tsukubensis]QFR96927.1 cytochrome P450 [Streptomyces tsukubensis]